MFSLTTEKPVVATPYTGEKKKKEKKKKKKKTSGEFGKNASEWNGRVKISSRKKSVAACEACMAIY